MNGTKHGIHGFGRLSGRVAILCLLCGSAGAQITTIKVRVPISGCNGCEPTDVDPCCIANTLSCFRSDFGPIQTNVGTPVTILATTLDCDNCFSNCPCCPVLLHNEGRGDCADCGHLPPKVCLSSISLTWDQSISIVLSSTLTATASIPQIASIEASLTQEIGVFLGVTYGFTGQCGWSAMPPCMHLQTTPSMSGYVGATAEIEHTWSASGVWATKPGCLATPCPIAPGPWNVAMCRQEVSTIAGNPYMNQSCGVNIELACP